MSLPHRSASRSAENFWSVLRDCGLSFNRQTGESVLSVDPIVFIRNLTNEFRKHAALEMRLTLFFEEAKNLIIYEEDALQVALGPTQFIPDDSDSSGPQDSLLRLLLRIEILQPSVIMLLLEVLMNYGRKPAKNLDMGLKIISQFRFLDFIVRSENITDKIFELVDELDERLREEFICVFPEMIDDEQHAVVAERLRDMLHENMNLLPCILSALTCLNLSSEVLVSIRERMLMHLSVVSREHYALIFHFLLQSASTNDSLDVIVEICSCVKEHGIEVFTVRSSDDRNVKVEDDTLRTLEQDISFSKHLSSAVLKYLGNLPLRSYLSIFEVVLLLVSYKISSKKKLVVALVRRVIRADQLNSDIIGQCFKLSAISKRMFGEFKQLASLLMRSPEPQLVQLGQVVYKNCFDVAADYMEQHEVVASLLEHIGSQISFEVDAAINVLQELANKDQEEIGDLVVMIESVVDYLSCLSSAQIKRTFCMLAKFAYGNNGDRQSLRDELQSIVQKYMNSSNSTKLMSIGVAGGLMIFKNSVNNASMSKDCIETLNYLEQQTKGCPRSRAMFYDELSDILSVTKVPREIYEHVNNEVFHYFRKNFIIESTFNKEQMRRMIDMDFEVSLALDPESELVISLLPAVIVEYRKTFKASIPAATICQSLRLLKVCEHEKDENLEEIDALLEAGIVLCDFDWVKEPSDASDEEKQIYCSCAFYACSWLREMLNAFSCCTDPSLQLKVRQRLVQVISMQAQFWKSVFAYPKFVVPHSCATGNGSGTATTAINFQSRQQKPKKRKTNKGRVMRKRKRNVDGEPQSTAAIASEEQQNSDSSDAEETESSNSMAAATKPIGKLLISSCDSEKYFYIFRELDMHVFKLLRYKITDGDDSAEDGFGIGAVEYLLKDLKRKTTRMLPAASKRVSALKTVLLQNAGMEKLMNTFDENSFAKECYNLMPYLRQHLDSCRLYLQEIVKAMDGVVDGPDMKSEKSLTYASCMLQLFAILSSYLAWRGFRIRGNQDLLVKSFKKLSGSDSDDVTDHVSILFDTLLPLADCTVDSKNAVALVRLLVAISDHATNFSRVKIADMCNSFLKTEWLSENGLPDRSVTFNQAVNYWLRTHIECSDDLTLNLIEHLIQTAVGECIENESMSSESYKTLNKHTISVYFAVMTTQLSDLAKSCAPLQSKTVSVDNDANSEQLLKWVKLVRCFTALMALTKKLDSRQNLSAALKFGGTFTECFTRGCMPLVDRLFAVQYNDIQNMLKLLQQATRQLQHVCTHSKVKQDAGLIRFVPPAKKSLEALIFRVKAAMVVNKCPQVFQIGCLKNRNVHGDEILSQATQNSLARSDTPADNMSEDYSGATDAGGSVSDSELLDDASFRSSDQSDLENDENSHDTEYSEAY